MRFKTAVSTITILVSVLFPIQKQVEAQTVIFEKTFTDFQEFYAVEEALDGFIVAGYGVNNNNEGFIIKLDQNGNFISGIHAGDDGYDIQRTPDNEFICCTSDGNNGSILIKLNASGGIQWQNTYPNILPGIIEIASTGNYKIHGGEGELIWEVNSSGQIVSQKDLTTQFNLPNNQSLRFSRRSNQFGPDHPNYLQNDNGDFFVLGHSCQDSMLQFTPLCRSTTNALVGKVNSNLNLIWTIEIGDTGTLERAIRPHWTPDGNILLMGQQGDDIADFTRPRIGWLLKMNTSGDVLWSKKYDIPWLSDENLFLSSNTTNDGGAIIGALALVNGDPNGFILKVDVNGNVQWYYKIAVGIWGPKIFDIIQTSDGDYVAVGYGGLTSYIIKIQGNSTAIEEEIMELKENVSIITDASNEKIMVSLKAPSHDSVLILVTDIAGKKVRTEIMTSNSISIDTNELNAGVYLVNVQNNKSSITKKVVIQ